uniref:NADH dehydrogenase subunit 4L n=1 Tax=Sphyranura euryceae TaxID=2996394 RepID=A0AA51U8Q3_9PLAT|nr:NADH dehydrogenase subunit 4L [Sphyranura euryceae]WMV02083.1 NADH dehydrogenase subunit 4L [Sphyranura euryceae]
MINSVFFFLIFFSLLIIINNFINLLIILENFNVLLLFYCLLNNNENTGTVFLSLLTIMTLEISFGLVVMSRMWVSSDLNYIVSL